VSNTIISSIRQSANMVNANKAYYLAEGALEVGLLEAANHEPGFSTSGNIELNCGQGETGCIKATYLIDGRIPAEKSYEGDYEGLYGIPAPGTGTAGTVCDPLKAFVKNDFYYSNTGGKTVYSDSAAQNFIGEIDPADHPCNWSTLKVGETVSIPLYTVLSADNVSDCSDIVEENGVQYCNPAGLNLSDLLVRMRTPCEGGFEMCSNPGRYDLYVIDDVTRHIEKDKTVVAWSIEGTNIMGDKSYYLGPIDKYDENLSLLREFYNSESYASKINTSTSNIILDLNENGGQDLEKTMGMINEFLKDGGIFSKAGNEKIHKPVLKLSVISSLVDHTSQGNEKVPYLEYQVLISNSVIPPTSSGATISVEALAGGFKQALEVNWPYSSSLLEYVIQQ
jgi:hypothetical protein